MRLLLITYCLLFIITSCKLTNLDGTRGGGDKYNYIDLFFNTFNNFSSSQEESLRHLLSPDDTITIDLSFSMLHDSLDNKTKVVTDSFFISTMKPAVYLSNDDKNRDTLVHDTSFFTSSTYQGQTHTQYKFTPNDSICSGWHTLYRNIFLQSFSSPYKDSVFIRIDGESWSHQQDSIYISTSEKYCNLEDNNSLDTTIVILDYPDTPSGNYYFSLEKMSALSSVEFELLDKTKIQLITASSEGKPLLVTPHFAYDNFIDSANFPIDFKTYKSHTHEFFKSDRHIFTFNDINTLEFHGDLEQQIISNTYENRSYKDYIQNKINNASSEGQYMYIEDNQDKSFIIREANNTYYLIKILDNKPSITADGLAGNVTLQIIH